MTDVTKTITQTNNALRMPKIMLSEMNKSTSETKNVLRNFVFFFRNEA